MRENDDSSSENLLGFNVENYSFNQHPAIKLTVLTLFTFFISFTAAGEVQTESPAVFFSDTTFSQEWLDKKTIRRKKAIAIGLAITLGPFGVHRLYLGTDDKIPVIYSITLGAFGILPLTDIIAIITTRDIEQYLNNRQIIMWMK